MTALQEKPRYLYRDPLAAAWMEKNHGMLFWNGHHQVILNPLVNADDDRPRYVHPQSLHLLEPIEYDIILRTNGYCQQVGWQIGLPKAKAQLDAGATIIRRGGVAFHWPESEAA